jgi:hypothetical protein
MEAELWRFTLHHARNLTHERIEQLWPYVRFRCRFRCQMLTKHQFPCIFWFFFFFFVFVTARDHRPANSDFPTVIEAEQFTSNALAGTIVDSCVGDNCHCN